MSGTATSARAALQAAVVARLRATVERATVFDAPPVRGAVPYLVVEEPVLADWSTKTWRGREGRVIVTAHDAGERPVRARELADAAEEALAAMPAAIGDEWRVVQLRLVRSRVQRAGGGDRWAAASEFAVRMWREEVPG